MSPESEFLKQTRDYFTYYRMLGEKAILRLTDQQIFEQPSSESNSIAVIVKHLSGNMKARWTDVFTSDGEKVTRNRDEEFSIHNESANDIRELWNEGWNTLFAALDSFSEEDMQKVITIRQEPHTIIRALIRQLTHYSYHVGQIVYTAKLLSNDTWMSLSIPKGQSSQFITSAPKFL